MAGFSIKLNLEDSRHLTETLQRLVSRVDDMRPVNEDVAAYMVNAAKLRISRDKTGPDGVKWQALSDTTNKLRAYDLEQKIANNEHQKGRYYMPGDALFQSGELYRSIRIGNISGKGWSVRADSPHASFMQFGIASTGGRIPGRSVPARPFLGFSATNKREIVKRMTKYLLSAVNRPEGPR